MHEQNRTSRTPASKVGTNKKTFIMKKMLIGFFAVLLAAATAFANYQPANKVAVDDVLYKHI